MRAAVHLRRFQMGRMTKTVGLYSATRCAKRLGQSLMTACRGDAVGSQQYPRWVAAW